MTEHHDRNDTSDWDTPGIRRVVLALGYAQIVLLLYAFYYVVKRANPKGDGMEIMLALPLLLVFFAFTLPALVKGLNHRKLARALVQVLIAAMLNAMLFLYIVGEMTKG